MKRQMKLNECKDEWNWNNGKIDEIGWMKERWK